MHPVVENAPGLAWRELKSGFEARWVARADLVKRGYIPKTARVWKGREVTDKDRVFISDRCQSLQTEMLVWGRGGITVVGGYDGTVSSLIRCYQTDQDSSFVKNRHCSKVYYYSLCRRIEKDQGHMKIADLNARLIKRWHETLIQPKKPGKPPAIALGHSVIGMFRTLVGFGLSILEDKECDRLSRVLKELRFPVGQARTEFLTAEQVVAIRTEAHKQGFHSIALAQAMQFEATQRQKDIIGEWVPSEEPVPSDILVAGKRWIRGIRWSEIDANLVLRHITSKRLKKVEVDLKLAPMVMEELRLLDHVPASGPLIISEKTKLPYEADAFRRNWRRLADACGVPKTVRNMDTRAGAITEALQSGARKDAVRKSATHSTEQMTERYGRGDADDIAEVMQSRVAARNKGRTNGA